MMPGVVADGYSKRGLKFEGSYFVGPLLRLAVQSGWRRVQDAYDLKFGSASLEWFVTDLLDSAQGPFADLLLAMADAELRRFNMREDEAELDESYPEWWEIEECAVPVAAAMERCLAAMSVLRDSEGEA